MKELASLPNVTCKISGVTTEADHKSWTREQLKPYIAHAIDSFGFERVMYGGDWHVSELAGTYPQWVEVLEWVVDAARMAALPASDREIVHLLPRGFVVDGHDGVRNPVGMYGARLEVEAHIVTGTSTVLANLMKCVQRAGLEVEEVVLQGLASASRRATSGW